MSTKLAADAAQGGKVSMTGLNTASLQARDTFLKTADSANQQMDALSMLANAAGLGQKGVNLLGRANKDMFNATGKDEHLVPAGGGGDVHLHLTVNGPVGSQSELEDWFVRTANLMARTGKLSQAVRTAG